MARDKLRVEKFRFTKISFFDRAISFGENKDGRSKEISR